MNNYEKMTNQQLIDEFNSIQKSSNVSRCNINRYVKNHHHELYEEIERRTAKLNQYTSKRKDGKARDISMFERLYCLQHGLDDRPMCIECKVNHVSGFMPHRDCYSQYCSQNCQKHSSIQAHRGLEKKKKIYGESNITNSKKAKKTRLERYGSYHPEDFGDKVKSTKMKNYGDENYVNVEKMRSTVEKHKSQNPDYYIERELKSKATKVRNGHDPSWNNREKFKDTVSKFSKERKEEIKHKRKLTNNEKYGCDNAMQNPDVRNKASCTCYDLYGVTCPLSTQKAKDAAARAIRKKAWKKLMRKSLGIEPMFSEEEFIACNSNDKEWKWRCKRCGHEFMRAWRNMNVHCPECFVLNYHGMQDEIYSFVKSICANDAVKKDDRKTFNNKMELDILDMTQNVAIEVNGLAWHNVDKMIYDKHIPISMMYHYDKTSRCEQKGIRLIHIFEDEWLDHKMLCKSKLKKLLSPGSMRKIDAYQCELCRDVSKDCKEKMLYKYTFYGDDGSSVAYSLKLRGKTVSMMTFSRTRKDKRHEWQILNYVEMSSFIIDGGFDKLMHAFCHDFNVKSISFYASRDWTTVNDIKCMDFADVKLPRMFWIKKLSRLKSSCINEANMHQFINEVDSSKPFIENMNSNGFYRLYDSGVLMFEKLFES